MNLQIRFSALHVVGYFFYALFALNLGSVVAQAQTPPAKKALIQWPASDSKDVTKYDIHYGTEAGFALSASTLKKTYGITEPPTTIYSYEHSATLPGDKHYYKVRIFDGKQSRFTVTKEIAILKSGADTYVFDVSYKEGLRSRAVAGGTEDNAKWNDEWHQAKLFFNITISKNGQELAKDQPFDLSLEGNNGNSTTAPRRAALIDVVTPTANSDTAAQWLNGTLPSAAAVADLTQQLTRTANSDGDIVARVISGQKISQPQLVIQWKDDKEKVHDVTKITLDFVASQSLRRFGVPLFSEWKAENDNGWEVTPDVLNSPGEKVIMTLHLKFHAVEGDGEVAYPEDLDAQGKPQLSADASDWKPVNGHHLQISIADVMRKMAKTSGTDTTYYNALLPENSLEVPNFVFFVDEQGYLIDQNGVRLQLDGQSVSDPNDFPNYVAPDYINVTTGANGTATVYLKAGVLIEKCIYFGLRVKDTSQTK